MEKIPPKLLAKWESILEDEGLGNVEKSMTNPKRHLMHGSGKYSYRQLTTKQNLELNTTRKEAIEEYYYRAEQFFNHYKHFTRIERSIYRLNITGLSIRDIVEERQKLNRPISRMTVHRIIKKLDKIMMGGDWDLRIVKKRRCKKISK